MESWPPGRIGGCLAVGFFYALMTAGSAVDHLRERGGQWKGRAALQS